MNATFIQQFITRLKADRPDFFKKLQIVAVVIGVVSLALGYVVGHATGLPEVVITLSKELATACGSIWFAAFLPNVDPKPASENQNP